MQDVADLYELTAEQIATLERFAEKSADALVAAVTASKAQSLSRLLFGLGIRHVGQEAAVLLARRFGTLDALASAGRDEIESVHGIGPAIAESAIAFFADHGVRRLLQRLMGFGLRTDEPAQAATSSVLAGKTVVITGTLPTLSRNEAKQLVIAAGGKVTDSVSKATSLVVVGEDAGSKLEKARALNVTTVTEAEFLELLKS